MNILDSAPDRNHPFFNAKMMDLENYFNGCKNNPWGDENRMTWDGVLQIVSEEGIEKAWEVLEREDHFAFHMDEGPDNI